MPEAEFSIINYSREDIFCHFKNSYLTVYLSITHIFLLIVLLMCFWFGTIIKHLLFYAGSCNSRVEMRVDISYSILSHNCAYLYDKVYFNTFIFMHLLICILQNIKCMNLCLIRSCVLIPCREDHPLKGYSSPLQRLIHILDSVHRIRWNGETS